MLQQNPLNAALVDGLDEFFLPAIADAITHHLNDDVIRFQTGVFLVARQTLLTGGATGQQLDGAFFALFLAGQVLDTLLQLSLLALAYLGGTVRALACKAAGLTPTAIRERHGLAE